MQYPMSAQSLRLDTGASFKLIMTRNLMKSFKPGAARALFLSTTAFAVSFAVWGLIGCLGVNYFVFIKASRAVQMATARI